MVADRAVHAIAAQAWQAAPDAIARSCQRAALYCIDRVPVADAAEGLSTLFNRARLF
jgi:hypothetical protein